MANTSRKVALKAPTPRQVAARRRAAALTQTEAAALVRSPLISWQHWEAKPGTPGHRQMHVAIWELFLIKSEPLLNGSTRKLKKIRSNAEWSSGYYCAVAVLLRETGCVSSEVQSLFGQGGGAIEHADAEDLALFREHGLIPDNPTDAMPRP